MSDFCSRMGGRILSRRGLLQATGAAAIAAPSALRAQQRPPAAQQDAPMPFPVYAGRSVVATAKGGTRRKNITDVLTAIDEQIRPVLKQKEYVVIKPNGLNATRALACSSAEAVQGVLDYLAPRFKGQVIVAESSGHSNTFEVYENFGYAKAAQGFRNVKLLDLNEEGKYEVETIMDPNMQPTPIRLAARLLDPKAYVICLAVSKTHVMAGATLSVKNMTLGVPLHQSPKESAKWNDKRRVHPNIRLLNYNMLSIARRMKPFWGATVIDGWEGMEGNGPASGTPVDHRVAVASTDYVAADRVMVEAMGLQADQIGHLVYCSRAGLGQYDLAKIDIRGEAVAALRKPYQPPADLQRTLEWTRPMES